MGSFMKNAANVNSAELHPRKRRVTSSRGDMMSIGLYDIQEMHLKIMENCITVFLSSNEK